MSARTVSAIGSWKPLPVTDDQSLVEVQTEIGDPGPHDLLVEVKAVSVNPVDVKVRADFEPGASPKILGFDAAGVVVGVGADVTEFVVGDEVFYAGSIARSGSNAARQLVDARIVGHKPVSLDFTDAAALPLTTITAWETLFDHFRLSRESTGSLLVLGAAGGVGSMIIQLARQLTDLRIIAAVSRENSGDWAREMGAHHVIDRRRLREEVPPHAPNGVNYIFTPNSAGQAQTYAEIMAVHGHVVAIDEPEALDTLPLKSKSQAWHWELMFTRPLFSPEDSAQHELLEEVARLVDAGTLRTTATTRLGPLNPDTLRRAHELVESGSTIGKVVISR